MKAAIRYYSKFGHTAKMAHVIEEIVRVRPEDVSVPLSEPVDTLYLGAGVFLGKIDSSVDTFIQTLTPDKVKRVICFGSCAIIKSPVPLMREKLMAQGITVSAQEFTCKGSMGPVHMGHPNAQDLEDFRQFIKSTL